MPYPKRKFDERRRDDVRRASAAPIVNTNNVAQKLRRYRTEFGLLVQQIDDSLAVLEDKPEGT